MLDARDDMYARLEEHVEKMDAKHLDMDAETVRLLEELSDDRFSFRDMARTLLEKVCENRKNTACARLLTNIIEEDVHG